MRILLLVVLFGTSIAHANPLTVTVKPATTTWKPKQPVAVALTVTNTGKATLKFGAMSCSWGNHWESADAELTWLPWACDKNAAATVTLDPGKTHDWTLEMFATDKAKLGGHTLQLTFTPIDGTPIKSKPIQIKVAP